MNQKDKELLLKDISARLPYGLMCQINDGTSGLADGKLIEIDTYYELVKFDADYCWVEYINDIKPYLRPMSSMTEEEEKEFINLRADVFKYGKHQRVGIIGIAGLDWLNAHYFDFRGLIEKGLALEAPEGMYNS
jgi:hypothetical protein